MVRRQRRAKYETKNGIVVNVLLTDNQQKLLKKKNVVTLMVEGRYIRLHPPMNRIVARKILQLQEQIKQLKKGARHGNKNPA